MLRADLERKAAAALELKKRRLKELTVYGIYHPEDGLIRCIQDDGTGNFVEVDKKPTFGVPLKLEPVVTTYVPIVVLEGGRGGAKSETVAGILSARIKDYGIKLGCFREFQNEIADSVHSIVSRKIVEAELPDFEILDSKILHENGGSVKYRGLARNSGGIKSMDDFDVFWVEEAQYISFRSLELLEPTLRKDGSQIIYTLNRGSSADPISAEHLVPYEKELRRDGIYNDGQVMVIRIGYEDNFWFPDNLEQKRLKNKASWSKSKYDHIWGGEYNDTVENAIISTEVFDACIDAHIKLGFKANGVKVVSHDPSDEGDDAKGHSLRHGSIFTQISEIKRSKIEDGIEDSLNIAIREQADAYTWDCDGMGIGARKQVVDTLHGKRIDYKIYKGSEGVERPSEIYQGDDLPYEYNQAKTNKQTFKNKRSQSSWMLRDRMHNTWKAVTKGEYINPDEMISIASTGVENMEQLRAEVCRIPLKENSNGYIQVMSKKEMWDRYKIPSPNMFDSMCMSAAYVPEIKTQTQNFHIPDAVNHYA